MEPDIKADMDRGEDISLMEPLLIGIGSRHRTDLLDLVTDLAQKSAGFRHSIPESLLPSLANLVRSMNCYYSNLIEGHDTHPVDIERALREDYSTDTKKRDLQLEAKAHISVQRWIDEGGTIGRIFAAETVCEIHRRFCAELPEEMLWVTDPITKENMKIIPGELRKRDVEVGAHLAISPLAVPRFLKRFEDTYTRLGKTETILAAAAAHHRLLWLHPFLDGNGRVARLMSHGLLLETLDNGAIWSVARGLARSSSTYKNHLANCDLQRRNDYDGRGTLSEEYLADFTKFFLETCIDQVEFMRSLMQPNTLRTRVLRWAKEEVELGHLPQNADLILEAILYRGELSRGDVSDLLGTGDRQARRVASSLLDRGVLVSDSTRAPLRLAFPAALASRWMPGLFPEVGD